MIYYQQEAQNHQNKLTETPPWVASLTGYQVFGRDTTCLHGDASWNFPCTVSGRFDICFSFQLSVKGSQLAFQYFTRKFQSGTFSSFFCFFVFFILRAHANRLVGISYYLVRTILCAWVNALFTKVILSTREDMNFLLLCTRWWLTSRDLNVSVLFCQKKNKSYPSLHATAQSIQSVLLFFFAL